jgi:hypothetical protein
MVATKTEAAAKYCPFKFALAADPRQSMFEYRLYRMGKIPPVPSPREEMGYCGLAGDPSDQDSR